MGNQVLKCGSPPALLPIPEFLCPAGVLLLLAELLPFSLAFEVERGAVHLTALFVETVFDSLQLEITIQFLSPFLLRQLIVELVVQQGFETAKQGFVTLDILHLGRCVGFESVQPAFTQFLQASLIVFPQQCLLYLDLLVELCQSIDALVPIAVFALDLGYQPRLLDKGVSFVLSGTWLLLIGRPSAVIEVGLDFFERVDGRLDALFDMAVEIIVMHCKFFVGMLMTVSGRFNVGQVVFQMPFDTLNLTGFGQHNIISGFIMFNFIIGHACLAAHQVLNSNRTSLPLLILDTAMIQTEQTVLESILDRLISHNCQ